jgi:adenylylsulfate kinase
VIVSLISPFKKERDWARSLFKDKQFKEIFISTSLEACEHRDTKGLYEKARCGEVKDFTGINSPYEAPDNPDIIIDTENKTVDECVHMILHKAGLV